MNVRTAKEILHFVLICHAALWVAILGYKLVLNPVSYTHLTLPTTERV